MCDSYMQCEENIQLTRQCLKIIEQYGFGLAIQTKSDLILRDLDLLKSINQKSKCVVQMTLTTFDEELCKIVEPNVCSTKRRFEVLQILKNCGIPTVVWITPILPFINDTYENIEGILSYCVQARVRGIICFGMGLTLRDGNREYYYKKLNEDFPGVCKKYQEKYGHSYEIVSDHNNELMSLLYKTCYENHILCRPNEVFEYLHSFEDNKNYQQLSLFD